LLSRPAIKSKLSMRNITKTILRPLTALYAPSNTPLVNKAKDSNKYNLDYTPVLKGKGKNKK
jgi:hypothetical protein